jgi:hypothetical protein
LRVNGSSGLSNPYTRAVFCAVVDAIIPPVQQCPSCGCACARPIIGAAGLRVYEYVIKQLDHSQFVPAGAAAAGTDIEPLSTSTARMMDIGAAALIRSGLAAGRHNRAISTTPLPYHDYQGGMFAALPRIDRLRTIALLDRLAVPLQTLPLPYYNNPGLVQTMMDSFHQLSMFGYYSEWFGYGTTRLLPPEDQHVEFDPPGWSFIGYPGPAYGYRAYRGTILQYPHRQGGIGSG